MIRKDEIEILALEALDKAPPASQLAEPLNYIFAEHFRQRVLCNILECIADQATLNRTKVIAALRFLKLDFGPHIIDEEEDLFPMLRRRAEPEDRIDDVLSELTQEHAADKLDAEQIMDGLSDVLADKGASILPVSLVKLLHRFAENERHHLTLENAIVLPLARVRLTTDDLRNMANRMATRRGISLPELSHAV